jgi:hypothetical protein
MWKFIKGCYSVTKETAKLVGQGVEELNTGLDILTNKLESFNEELKDTMPFRKAQSNLKAWKKIFELNRPLQSSKYLYEIFCMCELSIKEFEKITQIGIDRPNTRSIVLPLVNEIMEIWREALRKLMQNAEFKKELECMDENGLDKDAEFLTVHHYLIHTPKVKLEKMAKEEYATTKQINLRLLAIYERINTELS